MKRIFACALALAWSAIFDPAAAQTRFYVTSAASSLAAEGLAAAAPSGPEAAAFQQVPAPAVRTQANEAQATTAPFIEANGWRFERGIRKANYAKLPAGSATLAAAEAFGFGVDAILNPDPADVPELARFLRFLSSVRQPPMPVMANIGVIDDKSPAMDEVLNMLTRRNLLYKVVSAPDRKLDLTVQLGTKDFPREAVRNPSDFAARVREKLTDDKRLVRLYGNSATIAHLTGDGKRGRLFLLTYGRGRSQQGLRIRVLGNYQPNFAGYGSAEGAKVTDVEHLGNSTEFSVPSFNICAVIDLEDIGPSVIESEFAARDFALTADPNSAQWAKAPRVFASRDYFGITNPGPPLEIRARWTSQHLYLLYICAYDELNLKPDPNPAAETPQLWNWDVAEAFIGSDFENIARYKEFQVSPQSEWVDLEIERGNPQAGGMRWNSGYTVKGRIDAQAKIWYGEMRIPFTAIDTRPPEKGRELRIGLYRIAGVNPKKRYAWRPTGRTTFHVPQAFGTLRLK